MWLSCLGDDSAGAGESRKMKGMPYAALLLLLLVSISGAMSFPALDTVAGLPFNLATIPDPCVHANNNPVLDADDWYNNRREELLNLFRTNIYGYAPDRPTVERFEVFETSDTLRKGTITRKQVRIILEGPRGTDSFRVALFIPNIEKKKHPCFLYLWHRDTLKPNYTWNDYVLNMKYPSSAYSDTNASNGSAVFYIAWDSLFNHGYAVAMLRLWDVDADIDDGFRGGVHAVFDTFPSGSRPDDAWGTISAWAWGGSRVMDYFETDTDLDAERVAVIGFSRGGKAALWCGAQDTRFAITISHESGNGGAMLLRSHRGESISSINSQFPHWFCGNYKRFNGKPDSLPTDQHELISCVAPRAVYVASSQTNESGDIVADDEFYGIKLAESVYRFSGENGFKETRLPVLNKMILSEDTLMGYHVRTGGHHLLPFDWNQYIKFSDNRMNKLHVKIAQKVLSGENPCLLSIAPNPSNPRSVLSYNLSSRQNVRVRIYDLKGALLEARTLGFQDAGPHEIAFEGRGLSSSVYFCELMVGTRTYRQRVVWSK